jgi:TolB protein
MTQIHSRDGSAIAQLRRASVYLALALLFGLALAAAAKVMQGQAPRKARVLTVATTSLPGIALTEAAGQFGDSVRAIMRRDFDFSDRVRIASTSTLVGDPRLVSNATPADYSRFAKLGAAYVVSARLDNGRLAVTLFDVTAMRVAKERDYPLTGGPADPAARATIHAASDDVVEWVTGERGIAESRIVYVQGGRARVVDSDGANDHAVTSSGAALSPAWHPSGRAIVFSDFGDAGTQIAQLDLLTGRTTLLKASGRGLNITPVFTPDGSNIVYASGGEQPADLVIAPASNRGSARKMGAGSLTEQSSPTFSPDGHRVAFISPSPKTPQIYTMNIDGSDIQQLTPSVAGVRSYRTGPDWSPDGTKIAYEQQNGDFQIWMINIADKKMRKLTSVGENEDPSWAPDSRHVVIATTRNRAKYLFVLDTKTGRMRQLTHLDGARLAAWSPFLGGDTFLATSATVASVPVSGTR